MDSFLLEKIGLTRNESVTYLTLLAGGTLKVSYILKKSGLNSGKIYEILESLKNKGLVSESNINNVRFFTASPPNEILDYLEKQEEELFTKKELIKKELPKLEKSRKEYFNESKAITYIGMRGLKTAAYEALSTMKSGEEIVSMGVTGFKDEKINAFWKAFGAKRQEKRITARHIFSEKGKFFEEFRRVPLQKSRILPSITPTTVDIFGEDKAIIFNYQEPITSILVYDKNIAQSFKQFFEQLWAQAKSN